MFYRVVGDKRLHAFIDLLKRKRIAFKLLQKEKEIRFELQQAYLSFLTAACLSSGGIPRAEDWFNLYAEDFRIGTCNVVNFELRVSKRMASIESVMFSLSSPMTTIALTIMACVGWPTREFLSNVDVRDRLNDNMRRYVIFVCPGIVSCCVFFYIDCIDTHLDRDGFIYVCFANNR